MSATRNLGIANASGACLAFLDADDVWQPHRLERQIPVLAKYPEVGLVYGLATCVDEQNRPLRRPTGPFRYLGEYGVGTPGPPFDAYAGFLVGKLFAPVSTVLARTAVVKASGGFSEGLRYQIEDQILWTQIAKRAWFYFVNEVLAQYRVHSTSWSSGQDALSRLDMQLEHLTRIATEDGTMDSMLADGLAYFILRYWRSRRIPWSIRWQRTVEILGILRRHRRLAGVGLRYLGRKWQRAGRLLARPLAWLVRPESGGVRP